MFRVLCLIPSNPHTSHHERANTHAHTHTHPTGVNHLAPGHAGTEQTSSTSLNLFPVSHSGNDKEKMLQLHILHSPAFVQTPTETLECATQLTDGMWARQDRRSLQGEKKVTEYICKIVLLPATLESVTVEMCLAVGSTLQQDVRKQDLLLYINVLFGGHPSCKITSNPDRD